MATVSPRDGFMRPWEWGDRAPFSQMKSKPEKRKSGKISIMSITADFADKTKQKKIRNFKAFIQQTSWRD